MPVNSDAAPTLTAPLDGAATDRFGPTFIWEPMPGSPSYRLQVAADAAFSDVLVDTLVGTTDRLTLLDILPAGSVFYWRLQAGSGPAWSVAEAFQVGGAAASLAPSSRPPRSVASTPVAGASAMSKVGVEVPYLTGKTSRWEIAAFVGMMLFTIVLLTALIYAVPGL